MVYADFVYFISGLFSGIVLTMGLTYMVSSVYSRISGKPGPNGIVAKTSDLPFSIKDDNAEARIERELLRPQPGDGFGR